MSGSADRALYILAFDHRRSYERLLGWPHPPSAEQHAALRRGKEVVFAGLVQAIDRAELDSGRVGVLVDHEYGGTVPSSAKARGVTVVMPVERSGQEVVSFEDGHRELVDRVDPDLVKVLVRLNVDGSKTANDVQLDRLRQLSRWLETQGRPLLFELLVPPTAAQLHEVGGSRERYDAELRPGLMVRAIAALQDAGVVVASWKIEGLESRADCEAVAQATRSGGRGDVTCLVLGRGADTAKVEHWLAQAAPVEGFEGFAIGRSMWAEAVIAHLNGQLEAAHAADVIAERFAHFVDVYRRER